MARCGSITEASQQLRLAQPTISTQLKSFEEVLDHKLFERVGRNLKLTDSGRLAYKYAEQIFAIGSEFLEVLDGKSEGHLQEFKIGIADVVPKSIAYRLIEPALEPTSKVLVHCLEDKTEKLLASLSIGEIDLVVVDRPIPPHIKVKAFNHFIGECGISFLATRALAKKHKASFPGSLAKAPLLLPTTESAVRHQLDQWFEAKHIEPHCTAIFQDRALMKLAAREGKGIMPIPSVVEKEIKQEFNLELVGRIEEVKEQIYIVSIDRKLRNPLVQKICSHGQNSIFAK